MTCSQPAVSIVIPSYNHASYLPFTLQSVQAQTFTDWEAIVIDDGSTDETAAAVLGISDARIHYHYQSNHGLSASRNRGIQLALGQFIALLDADDIWREGFLETMVSKLCSSPDADAIYCGHGYIDRDGTLLPEFVSRVEPPHQLFNQLVGGNFIVSHAVVVLKSVYEEVGFFDEKLHTGEDLDMWLRIARRGRFIGIPNVLALYRRHGRAMSDDPDWMYSAYRLVLEKHFGASDTDMATWSTEKCLAYRTIYLYAAEAYLRSGNIPASSEGLIRAMRLSPSLAYDAGLYHRIAASHRPLDQIGMLERIELDRARHDWDALIDYIYGDKESAASMPIPRLVLVGNAYLALAQLAAWQGLQMRAREYLQRAVCIHPTLLKNPATWRTLASATPFGPSARKWVKKHWP